MIEYVNKREREKWDVTMRLSVIVGGEIQPNQ